MDARLSSTLLEQLPRGVAMPDASTNRGEAGVTVRGLAMHVIAARLAGTLLTPALLVLSFPAPDQGWLAWVALVPLLLACRDLGLVAAFALGLLSGVGMTFGLFHWMFEVSGFRVYHMLLGALYLGLYPAAWCGGLALLTRSRLSLIVTAPALWVALDYLRAHAGFLAFPWGTLAQSQHGNLAVLQVATLTGEYGVTCLVVMGSAAVAALITRRAWRTAIAAGSLIALAHVGGALALAHPLAGSTLMVAIVQPSILISERSTASARAATLDRLERLTRAAAATRPALIAWPETAVRDLPKEPPLVARVQELARAIQTPLLVGASEFVKFAAREGDLPLVLHPRSYNAAYLVVPHAPLGEPYRKRLLVPFGEYLPLEGIIRWPTWFVPRVFASVPGDGPRPFMLPDGTRFAVLICWENLFGAFVRPSVREGAHLLVQLTNDNWFGRTAASRQHNLASVLRAVENRVPVVIASNTGPSQIIDPYGRIVAAAPGLFVEGIAAAEVPLGAGGTLYTRVGDLFAFAALATLALGAMWRREGDSRATGPRLRSRSRVD